MSDRVKLGTTIQKFSNAPLQLELLLFPEKLKNAKISAGLKKQHQEVYDQLFYSGQGKSYTLEGNTKYYKNKNGFYVLELPDTTSPDCEKENTCRIKDDLGYKLGKAESNPTSAESGTVSAASGGLFGRLKSYFIELGKNVRILHLRVFENEDLNFYGTKKRARDYESAIKRELRLKNIQPIRGATGSEYFKNIKDIQTAISKVDKYPNTFVRDIAPDEKEGQQIGANVETRSTSKQVKVKSRVIVLSREYKMGREKFGAARGTVIKKTKSNPNDKNWDIIFDDQLNKGVSKATIDMPFNMDLYNENIDGSWVFENDKNVLKAFSKAPKVL
tara:strand:+ start:4382 stop:5374 length:993 start_codon:yes stop_codon:yes gene_type:complete